MPRLISHQVSPHSAGEVFIRGMQVVPFRDRLRIAPPPKDDVFRVLVRKFRLSGGAQIVKYTLPRFMPRLADQTLLLAKEDTGLAECPPVNIDLPELLEQVATDLEPLAEEKSITLRWQESVPCHVLGDAQRLRRVFLDLIDNAIKFTPAGGAISLGMNERQGYVVVTISDTGCGIAPHHIPHIFERFYRVDASRDRAPGGAGQGLAISRAIVQRHGGEIQVASRERVGTAITVAFPSAAHEPMFEIDNEAVRFRDALAS